MSGYDRAITVFSPDGHLFQVEYAMEAVKQGAAALALKCQDCIIFAAEDRSPAKLQKQKALRKIQVLDDHLVGVSAGFTADARVLINRARLECQSYRLTYEDPPTARGLAKFVGELQQTYTTRGGRRPFGVATLIGGWDMEGDEMALFRTTPAGVYTEWKANAVGRKDKTLNDYLEENYTEDLSSEAGVKLAIQALLEVVEHGAKNINIGVLRRKRSLEVLTKDEIEAIVTAIREEEAAASSGDS